MTRDVISVGYILFLLFILVANFWAINNPTKLESLPEILSRLMRSRSTRLALGIIWWWLGWHFLYANL